MAGLNGKILGMTDSARRRPVHKALVERVFRRLEALVGSTSLAPHGEASGDTKALLQRQQADGDKSLSTSAQYTLQEFELVLKDSLAGQRPAVALEFDPVTHYCTGWELLGGHHGNL